MASKRTPSMKGANSQQRLSFNVRKKDNAPIDKKEKDVRSNAKAEPIEIIDTSDLKGSHPHLNPEDAIYQEYYQSLIKDEWSDPGKSSG
ncbi:hypothetical protein TRICI_005505 [Trichomonascus ciferrii]|uniref:Uncharacterized protein n=1 Tax=Trichomonascus ciferrii TaxID=44093 RepID=A0A642UYY4_9ASCO|nr:hypothetical protein TRICI_005505 [Trichomonascus ciferrii]